MIFVIKIARTFTTTPPRHLEMIKSTIRRFFNFWYYGVISTELIKCQKSPGCLREIKLTTVQRRSAGVDQLLDVPDRQKFIHVDGPVIPLQDLGCG